MTERDAHEVATEFLASHRIRTIRLVFPDLHGVLRGKVLPADEYIRRIPAGFRFSRAVFARDATGRRVDATGLTFDSGAGDFIAVPDPHTYCVTPWQPGMGQVIADLFSTDGTPVPYAPRTVLRHVEQLARASEVSPSVAPELEFYLLEPRSYAPVSSNTQPYHALDLTHTDFSVDDILSTLIAMQLPVDTLHREAGPGQFEITLRRTTPLRMADHAVLLKSAVKECSRKRRLVATFMAKPFADQPGSGFHLHQSLWDAQERSNLFSSAHGKELSTLALHFVAGQLRHLPAATAFFAPTVNSYKRLGPKTFAPAGCTWGYDNRTAALRVPERVGAGCRVELRVPGADANPYLVAAASLAAGLLGLREGELPPDPTAGDAHGLPGAVPLPASLPHALESLKADVALTGLLGDALPRLLRTVKCAEHEQYERHITDWERRVYLDLL